MLPRLKPANFPTEDAYIELIPTSARNRTVETMVILPISKPFFDQHEAEAVARVLSSGWVAQGPEVEAFEREFARQVDAPYAVACSSGTTALHLMLTALGIGPGDEVIVPAFSWVATANTVVHCGAVPVFCDVEEKSGNIDVTKVKACITGRTKAIIAVHLFGRCADIDALKTAAGSIPVLEDAACAFGSAFHGRHAGTLGLMAAFSFHPRKSITTGEGGMVTTSDPKLAERIKNLRNHGIDPNQTRTGQDLADMPDAGFNYRLTDIQAAVGRVQLAKWDAIRQMRQQGAELYYKGLEKIKWLALPPRSDRKFGHSFQSFIVRLTENAPLNRTELMKYLQNSGITTRPGTYCIADTAYYHSRFRSAGSCPVAARLERQSLALPIFAGMTDQQYAYVVEQILKSSDRRACA